MKFTFTIILLITIAGGLIFCKIARNLNTSAARSLAAVESTEAAGNGQRLAAIKISQDFEQARQRAAEDRRLADLLGISVDDYYRSIALRKAAGR
jgi:hypothetical protein